MRNVDMLQFTLFEYEAARYIPANYVWKLSKKNNLQGHDKNTDKHCFTWQFSGSQFTVIKDVPGSAHKFRINKHPGMIAAHQVLNLIGYRDEWIERVN